MISEQARVKLKEFPAERGRTGRCAAAEQEGGRLGVAGRPLRSPHAV